MFSKLSNPHCSTNNSAFATPTHKHSHTFLSCVSVCLGSADFNRSGQINRIGGSSGVCKLQIHPGAAGATAGERPAETEQMDGQEKKRNEKDSNLGEK